MDKSLARLIKKKRRAPIKSELADTTEILRIMRLLQLYTNKMDNLEESDKFLIYNLLRLKH